MVKGLKRGTVRLENYNPVWATDFVAEKVRLQRVFGGAAVAIEHVGSTAVPGLAAKPIIDIEVGLRHFEVWRGFIKPLESIGYTFMPERVNPDEVFMPKGPEERRTHYLHITWFGSSEWQKTLKFRDSLRANQTLRQEYEQLKQRLAQQFPDGRKAYSAAKANFIERIIMQ